MEIIYSVVVPVYNSESTLHELHQRLSEVLVQTNEFYEIIFVDDGSVDSSWNKLLAISEIDKNVSIIRLNRNYGQHNAIMSGFNHIRGQWVITLDDDLQNPPEEISKLIQEKENGYDLVYGIFKEKKHTFFRNLGSSFVQFIYRRIFNLDKKISSFRIIRGSIVKAITGFNNSFIFLDGLFVWYTVSIANVQVEHNPRRTRKTNYSFKKLVLLGITMLTNFSIFPVQIASLLGFFFSIIGFGLGFFFFLSKIFLKITVPGYASIIVAIAFFSGIQLLTIGIIGEYISRIHSNQNERPQYYIGDSHLSHDDDK